MSEENLSCRKSKPKFSLRSLRLSLKYRPEIMKLILKMRHCIRKRNSLLKSLKHRLKDMESNFKTDSSISKSDVTTQTESIKTADFSHSSIQIGDETKNQEEMDQKAKPDIRKENTGWVIGKENGDAEKSIAEQVAEVAQSALQDTGMVYVESAGMYYDYKTGYYYNSELGLYYHTDTGCYYCYSEDKQFVFHSYPDMSKVNSSLIAHQAKKAKKLKRARQSEEDVDNLTKSLSQDKEDGAKAKRRKTKKDKKESKKEKKESRKEKKKSKKDKGETRKGKKASKDNKTKKRKTSVREIEGKAKIENEVIEQNASNIDNKAQIKIGEEHDYKMKDENDSQTTSDVVMLEINNTFEAKMDTNIEVEVKVNDEVKPEDRESESVTETKAIVENLDISQAHMENLVESEVQNVNKNQTDVAVESNNRNDVTKPELDVDNNKADSDSEMKNDNEIQTDIVENDTQNEVPKADLEDGECSETESEKSIEVSDDDDDDDDDDNSNASDASTSSISDEDSVAKHHPPCMRVIVRETTLPKLKVGSLFIVTKDGGTIGREGDQHAIVIKDHNVSRNHLDIKYDMTRKTYVVIDLGSKNGTILNGNRMSESQEVSSPCDILHGSTIQLGETKLLCHIHPGHVTCGHCEPGLLIETEEEKKVAYTRTCNIKKQHELELARLKNLYAPQHLAIEEKPYNDRAQARREAVGSTNHAEKTQATDLDTSISSDNKGFKLLQKMGWSDGEGLGKDSQGKTEPVPLISNEGKAGLGTSGAVSAPSNTPKPRVRNNLAQATMRLATRTKMLQPPAKAFQNTLDEDSE